MEKPINPLFKKGDKVLYQNSEAIVTEICGFDGKRNRYAIAYGTLIKDSDVLGVKEPELKLLE